MNGILYIVATPIGNLDDFSSRAINVLRSVDYIAAEDTRNSSVLLNRFNIEAKLISNHKFNENSKSDLLIDELCGGKSIAVISDAGTPCVSDPGYVLVNKAINAGIQVIGIPGACAAITAISVSGFNAASFSFYGFLPRTEKEIKSILASISDSYTPVSIFYESPKRIIKTMEIIAETIPGYNICLCNDLTKKFERIYRGIASGVSCMLSENEFSEKGEYTIITERTHEPEVNECEAEIVSIEAMLIDISIKEKCSLKTAINIYLTRHAGARRNDVYSASLALKKAINSIINGEN
jgi:16S rRNA (cytidine1402-2'-O)-methyltransferase